MKLTLRELAPYLPYQLKVKITENFISPYNMNPIQKEGNVIKFDCYIILLMSSGLKFILRPLSDLVKEIEVDGEKFVPIEEIKRKYTEYYFATNNESMLSIKGKNEMYVFSNHFISIQNKLFEWHFDVFGLIEQGLAIDINTLNQKK